MNLDVGKSTRVKVTTDPEGMSDDAYPDVIGDQRTVYGQTFTGAEDVWSWWEVWLAKQNKVLTADPRQVVPYINESRWVADCLECNGGMGCWDRNPYACCMDCGHRFKVRWQQPSERSAVIRLLAGRHPKHRNWVAGESLGKLERDNALMGIGTESRDGLVVAANVPTNLDALTTHDEKLDGLHR